jgi:hypothetical protein
LEYWSERGEDECSQVTILSAWRVLFYLPIKAGSIASTKAFSTNLQDRPSGADVRIIQLPGHVNFVAIVWVDEFLTSLAAAPTASSYA